jgi:DNA-binding MarR family transcriptional regulator
MTKPRTQLSTADALRELIDVLPRVLRGLRRIKAEQGDDKELNPAGNLGPRHGKVVLLLLDGPQTVGQLAQTLDLTLASTSNLVADLDHAGLAQRHQDPDDRRRTIVSIVPERREAIQAWLTTATAPLRRTLDRLTANERASLIKGLDTLAEELGPLEDSPDCPASPTE